MRTIFGSELLVRGASKSPSLEKEKSAQHLPLHLRKLLYNFNSAKYILGCHPVLSLKGHKLSMLQPCPFMASNYANSYLVPKMHAREREEGRQTEMQREADPGREKEEGRKDMIMMHRRRRSCLEGEVLAPKRQEGKKGHPGRPQERGEEEKKGRRRGREKEEGGKQRPRTPRCSLHQK